jgi:type II secretory pathway component GspD/PulD (secretin)
MIWHVTTKHLCPPPAGPVLGIILIAAAFTHAQDAAPSRTNAPAPRGQAAATRPSQTIQDTLDRTLPEVVFDAVAFDDVIDFLRDVSGANMFVNWKVLDAAGVDRKTPVTARLRNVKYSRALHEILAAVGGVGKKKLDYTVVQGVITISTVEDLAQYAEVRVYDLRDLLVTIPDFEPIDRAKPVTTQPAETRQDRIDQIIGVIEQTIAPESWKDHGGSGTIRELQGQLIIRQMPENQALISKLLDQLHEAGGVQVTVEVRIVSCDDTLTNALLADWQKAAAPATQPVVKVEPTTRPGVSSPAFHLSEAQVNQFLLKAQSADAASILSAPRISLFSGQRASVQVTSAQTYVSEYAIVQSPDGQKRYDPVRATVEPGLMLDVRATVSSDRKFVTLNLRSKVSALLGMKHVPWPSRPEGSTLMVDEPQIKSSDLQSTIKIPNNGTVVLGGMQDPESTNVQATTRPAAHPRYLLLLVKPTVILQPESGQKQFPLLNTKIEP